MPLLVRPTPDRFLRKATSKRRCRGRFYVVRQRGQRPIRRRTRSRSPRGQASPRSKGSTRSRRVSGECRGCTTVFELPPASSSPTTHRKRRKHRSEGLPKSCAISPGGSPRAKAATLILTAIELLQVLPRPRDGARPDPGASRCAARFGKKGSGVNGFPAMTIGWVTTPVISSGRLPLPKPGLAPDGRSDGASLPEAQARGADRRDDPLRARPRRLSRSGGHLSGTCSSTTSTVGSRRLYGASDRWDPSMKRPLSASTSKRPIEKGWQIAPSERSVSRVSSSKWAATSFAARAAATGSSTTSCPSST